MENGIEAKSFELLNSLEVYDIDNNIKITESINERKYKGQGTSEILRIENDKIGIGKFYKTNPQTRKKSIKVKFSNSYLIITEVKYEILTNIITSLYNISFFANNATNDFLEEKIIEWIIKYISEKRISISLINFLYSSIEENSKEYVFYFIIDSLAIEKPFDLMTTEVTFLTEEMILLEYEKLKLFRAATIEEINELFKEHKDAIIAKTKVKGILKKAELLAKERVTLALSVFKLFFSHESVMEYYQMFDLNFKSKRLSTYSFIFESVSNEFDFEKVMEVRHGVSPIFIDDNVLNNIANEKILYLLEFISNYKDNELNNLIIDSINDLADCFSIRNFHERSTKVVSFFEGILLPKTHRKGEGETYLKRNLLDKMDLPESDKVLSKRIIRNFYEIRHKYLHNKVELPIELSELDTLQYLALKLIFFLVFKSKEMTTIEALHNYLGIKTN